MIFIYIEKPKKTIEIKKIVLKISKKSFVSIESIQIFFLSYLVILLNSFKINLILI